MNLDFSSKQNVKFKGIKSNFFIKETRSMFFFFEKYVDFDFLSPLIHKILSSIKKS